MKSVFFALLFGIVSVQATYAACTTPVGRYTGSGAGLNIDSTGSIVGGGAIQFSIKFVAGGIWRGKYWSSVDGENETRKITIPAIGTAGNVFNKTTCHGLLTVDGGDTFSYVVSDRGKVVELILWESIAGNEAWTVVITLRKL